MDVSVAGGANAPEVYLRGTIVGRGIAAVYRTIRSQARPIPWCSRARASRDRAIASGTTTEEARARARVVRRERIVQQARDSDESPVERERGDGRRRSGSPPTVRGDARAMRHIAVVPCLFAQPVFELQCTGVQ